MTLNKKLRKDVASSVLKICFVSGLYLLVFGFILFSLIFTFAILFATMYKHNSTTFHGDKVQLLTVRGSLLDCTCILTKNFTENFSETRGILHSRLLIQEFC